MDFNVICVSFEVTTMYRMRSILLLGLLSFFLSCQPSTSQSTVKGIDLGKMENATYFNGQFNLAIPLPAGWHFVRDENTAKIAEQNVENVFEGIKHEAHTEYVLEKVALIFTLFKYDPSEGRVVNPNMTITATDIRDAPESANVDRVIRDIKEGFLETGIDVAFSDTPLDEVINKHIFKGYSFAVTNEYGSAKYESYVANYGDYNLLITISYTNGIEREELIEVIRNIEELN